MKAFIKFDLENEDDKLEFKLMQKAPSMSCFIESYYNQYLRQRRKYGEMSAEQSQLIEELCDEWFCLKQQYGLDDLE